MTVFVLLADHGFDGNEIVSIHSNLEAAMGGHTDWQQTHLVKWVHGPDGSQLVHTAEPVVPGHWTRDGNSDTDVLAPSYIIEEWEVQ